MAGRKTRKQKENIHHPFLISWEPSGSYVKGESDFALKPQSSKQKAVKRADILAQGEINRNIKKNVIRSLSIASLMLILEVVIYLALK